MNISITITAGIVMWGDTYFIRGFAFQMEPAGIQSCPQMTITRRELLIETGEGDEKTWTTCSSITVDELVVRDRDSEIGHSSLLRSHSCFVARPHFNGFMLAAVKKWILLRWFLSLRAC